MLARVNSKFMVKIALRVWIRFRVRVWVRFRIKVSAKVLMWTFIFDSRQNGRGHGNHAYNSFFAQICEKKIARRTRPWLSSFSLCNISKQNYHKTPSDSPEAIVVVHGCTDFHPQI